MTLPVYKNPDYLKFVQECTKAGLDVHHYEGRNFYIGPAVIHEDPQFVVRKTSMTLVWDNMGKADFIIHPR